MVQAGTLTTRADGSVALVGQFSGLNTEALVEATILAQRLPAVSLERQISQDKLESTALGELNTILNNLRNSANKLRNEPGFSAAQNNTFQQRSAFLTSSTSTTASSVLGLSVDAGTPTGTYQIEVLQTAKANKLSSGAVANASSAQNVTDTLTIGLSGGTTANISITPDLTLDQIASAINAEQSNTKVRASVLKISDTESRLILTAEETGKDIQLSGSSGEFLTTFGSGGSLETVQTADKARIRVDGISTVIERDSNDINDVISGVKIQLFKEDPGNTITLEVGQNLGGIRTEIESFVASYNALREFYDAQRNFDPNDSNATQPALYSSSILRDALSSVSGILGTGPQGITSGNIATLREVGITLNQESRLVIDSAELEDALVNNPQQLENLFSFTFESSDPNLRVLSRSQAVFPDDFEITIDGVDSSGNITGASVTGLGNVFDISGKVLTGKAGTAFEGLSLFYGGEDGSGSNTITVQNSVGVAEQFFNTLEDFVAPGTGRISERVLQIEEVNSDRTDQIAAIDARLALTRQFLIDRYARLEQALAQADASRRQLEAFANASNNNN
ncbi:flagellar filament capping protein FliD [Kiloniella sp. b19]|uniref:flagellar filament capping protein FliD n=1 Tax=Kiloniella sp. GXU_MW_B19 TaxID=3141326 RepID=UPI0031DA4DDA